jgi:hypothetical protein
MDASRPDEYGLGMRRSGIESVNGSIGQEGGSVSTFFHEKLLGS